MKIVFTKDPFLTGRPDQFVVWPESIKAQVAALENDTLRAIMQALIRKTDWMGARYACGVIIEHAALINLYSLYVADGPIATSVGELYACDRPAIVNVCGMLSPIVEGF